MKDRDLRREAVTSARPVGARVLAVIPARYGSSRLPGKVLLPIGGVPLVRHMVGSVAASGVADEIVVATDDQRVVDVLRGSEVEVVCEGGTFACGSDRVAAIARGRNADRVLNVQVDEALVDARILRAALDALEGRPLGTVAVPGPTEQAWLDDRNAVKVLCDQQGRAIDFRRDVGALPPVTSGWRVLFHLGVYAFWRDSLQAFAALPVGRRERDEHLEQLRVLEQGWSIGVTVVDGVAAAINTHADLPVVDRLLAAACAQSPCLAARDAGASVSMLAGGPLVKEV